MLASLVFTFLLLNLVANLALPRLIRQELFPRQLLNSIGAWYQTFYPSTYDRAPERWTAVLGDSHAAGSGDAFQDGESAYSVAHLLRERDGESYLVLGRSGFGSVNATRELFLTLAESSRSFFSPTLAPPARVLFLFYEGNDLDNNLHQMEALGVGAGGIREFVRAELDRPPELARRVDFYLPLVRLLFGRATREKLLAKLNRSVSEPGEPVPRGVNSLELNGDLALVRIELQAAAPEVTAEELSDALAVFFECLRVLKERLPAAPLEVVYLPSPTTVYSWREPISIQAYHPGRGKTTTTNAENAERSLRIRDRIAAHATAHGYGFVDVTDAMRERARSAKLHGPADWKHPNRSGYELVRDAILDARSRN